MSIFKHIIVMGLFSFLFGAQAQEHNNIKVLDKTEFKQALAKGNTQLIDVRTLAEYEAGHIENAVNIDYFDAANFEEKINRFDKDKPIYLYCKSGNRSGKAAVKLDSLGFKEIYDLRGGYLGW